MTQHKTPGFVTRAIALELQHEGLKTLVREYFAASDAADEAPDNRIMTEADKQRAARRAVEAESKLREAVK